MNFEMSFCTLLLICTCLTCLVICSKKKKKHISYLLVHIGMSKVSVHGEGCVCWMYCNISHCTQTEGHSDTRNICQGRGVVILGKPDIRVETINKETPSLEEDSSGLSTASRMVKAMYSVSIRNLMTCFLDQSKLFTSLLLILANIPGFNPSFTCYQIPPSLLLI